MGVNQIDQILPLSGGCNSVDWDYLPLREIQYLGVGGHSEARIIIEDDQGGTMYSLFCRGTELDYLGPYYSALQACAQAPIDNEVPLLPVRFNKSGRPEFCPAGALQDYPELAHSRRRARLDPEVSRQLREEAQKREMTPAEFVLSAILKKASKSG